MGQLSFRDLYHSSPSLEMYGWKQYRNINHEAKGMPIVLLNYSFLRPHGMSTPQDLSIATPAINITVNVELEMMDYLTYNHIIHINICLHCKCDMPFATDLGLVL